MGPLCLEYEVGLRWARKEQATVPRHWVACMLITSTSQQDHKYNRRCLVDMQTGTKHAWYTCPKVGEVKPSDPNVTTSTVHLLQVKRTDSHGTMVCLYRWKACTVV